MVTNSRDRGYSFPQDRRVQVMGYEATSIGTPWFYRKGGGGGGRGWGCNGGATPNRLADKQRRKKSVPTFNQRWYKSMTPFFAEKQRVKKKKKKIIWILWRRGQLCKPPHQYTSDFTSLKRQVQITWITSKKKIYRLHKTYTVYNKWE